MGTLVPVLAGSLIFAAVAFGIHELRVSSPHFGIDPTISIQGTGTITAKPDIASFSFNVHSEEETQEATQAKAAERENAILSYLREQGVADEDLKTSGYNLSPRYEYKIDTTCRTYCPGEQVQIGYQVDETVTVTVRDLARAGEFIAGAGARGAENISQLSYSIEDDAAFREEAIALAVKDAYEKAKTRAKSLNMRLGKLQSFSEQFSEPYYPVYSTKAMSLDESSSATPELPTGEREIKASVSATYYLK